MKFKPAKSATGIYSPIAEEFPIATGTAIERGEIVLLTPAVGIAAVAGTDFDDPAFGVAAEDHNGSTAGRQVGLKIKVYTDPNLIYSLRNDNIITATGGSATTFVVAGLLPATDNLWIGGMLEVVTCAADATMIGKRIPITGSTGTGGTLTFPTQTAAFASGDTAKLCPGKLAVGLLGWDLTSDGTDVDWDTSGGEALQLVGSDPTNMISYWKIRLHQMGNSTLAI